MRQPTANSHRSSHRARAREHHQFIDRHGWVVIKIVVRRVRAWIAPSSRVDANQRLDSTSFGAQRCAASPRAVFILHTHRERAVHMSIREWLASFEVASRDMHGVVRQWVHVFYYELCVCVGEWSLS